MIMPRDYARVSRFFLAAGVFWRRSIPMTADDEAHKKLFEARRQAAENDLNENERRNGHGRARARRARTRAAKAVSAEVCRRHAVLVSRRVSLGFHAAGDLGHR